MKNIVILFVLGLFLIFSDSANACTSFVISGKYTADGKSMLFKNRDTGEMNNALVMFNDGKYKYMGVVNATEKAWNKAVWGGYNETGFAIINTAAYNNNVGDTTKVKGHDGWLMKQALMVCSSLEDFETFLDTLTKPMGVNSNFGVIDANGGAAYYETGNYKYVKCDANDPALAPRGILVRTNHSMSGDLSEGLGYNRFNNASMLLEQAWEEKNLTPQHLLKVIPRSLYHPRTKTDLSKNIPENRNTTDFRFFIDYIPRYQTSSTFMIVSAKDAEHVDETMMWTILGFPLASVAIPAWISAGELPKAVKMNDEYKAPFCNAALKLKEDCFPITMDKGFNYINLSAVINKEGTGYYQMLQPVENEIFTKADKLMASLGESKKKSTEAIQEFYAWLDNYLETTYEELFHFDLFSL